MTRNRGRAATPPSVSAKAYAVRLLSQREYSARTLKDKLLQRGYPPEEAAVAVEAMQSYGYQDDARFAEMRARQDARRMGNRRVSQSLVERGVDKEVALERVAELEPEDERILSVIDRFRGKHLDEALKAKAWRFLAYRGFSPGSIKVALRALAEDSPAVPGVDD